MLEKLYGKHESIEERLSKLDGLVSEKLESYKIQGKQNKFAEKKSFF